MNFGTYKGEAIVLSRKDFSEADRILTVYSKEFGKLSLLAKGIKRPKSRKRGNLEVFSQIKFLAAKTKGLGILVEVALIESFSYLRKDPKEKTLVNSDQVLEQIIERKINSKIVGKRILT